MEKITKLTEGQQTLFLLLRAAIFDEENKESVADILKKYKPENKGSYDTDIKAVFTAFFNESFSKDNTNRSYTLSALAVARYNAKALKHILDAAKKIKGLERRILTEVQFKGFDNNSYIYRLFDYANLIKKSAEKRLEYGNNHSEVFFINKDCYIREAKRKLNEATKIVGIIEALDISIPQEQESPSFLSQHKGKVAIIGAVALAGTIAAFMSGHPIIGIIVALAATFMLATEEGREVCDEVGERLYDVLPECFKSQETAKLINII